MKTRVVTPCFYYVFNISLSCHNNIPSFIGNLWRVLLLGNHFVTMTSIVRLSYNRSCLIDKTHSKCENNWGYYIVKHRARPLKMRVMYHGKCSFVHLTGFYLLNCMKMLLFPPADHEYDHVTTSNTADYVHLQGSWACVSQS